MKYNKYKGIELHWEDTGYLCTVFAEKCKNPYPEKFGEYPNVRRVYPFDNINKTLMYIARGNKYAKNEVVVFYPNGTMHSSYKNNMTDAFKMGVKDAINYL